MLTRSLAERAGSPSLATRAMIPLDFVAGCRELNVTPHVAQNERRPGGSALDQRTSGWPGYALSQRVRKRVEEIFGWSKTVGNFRRTRYRGSRADQLRRLSGGSRLQSAEDCEALSDRMSPAGK